MQTECPNLCDRYLFEEILSSHLYWPQTKQTNRFFHHPGELPAVAII